MYIDILWIYMYKCIYRGVGSFSKVGRPCMQGISCTAYVMATFASHENACVANITAYSEIVPVMIRNGGYYC